jgi:uncharacterized membrane protein YhaH (DUF805 family)
MSHSTRHFIRHFVEMLLAMAIGMVALGVAGETALQLLGSSSSELRDDAPAVTLVAIGLAMTVPMVAWMRHRGHDWRLSAEMATAMLIPTVAVIALLAAGVVTEYGTLIAVEHYVMLPGMLIAILLRREEYAHGLYAGAAEVAA